MVEARQEDKTTKENKETEKVLNKKLFGSKIPEKKTSF